MTRLPVDRPARAVPLAPALALALALAPILLASAARPATAQAPAARGAVRLHELVRGLTVTARVLVVGARPEDADDRLLAWLARGRDVETAYLSLTRDESGENFLGAESGIALGAIRTAEALAARRVDGAEQFFTRAYDFGFARSADEAFRRWPHDSLLGDVVIVIRAFRPQVIVAVGTEATDSLDGLRQAAARLVGEAFDAAADSAHFPTGRFGAPWAPLALYRHGAGVAIDPTEYDPVIGATYADIADEARAMRRTEGFLEPPPPRECCVRLRRARSRVSDSTPAAERSIFDRVDTTFARLSSGASPEVVETLARFAAYADSARRALDLERPAGAVRYLAQAATLAAGVRTRARGCRHPAADALPPPTPTLPCDARQLDLDASADLMRRRANDALLAAAGITLEATADHELIAHRDTVPVRIAMANHGTEPATLLGVYVSGGVAEALAPMRVPPDSVGHVTRRVSTLAEPSPWWIDTRANEMYPDIESSARGLLRPGYQPSPQSVPGVAVPETIRRPSDVTVTLLVGGATVSTSLGPIRYRAAEPETGVQERAVAGAPSVTLMLDRSLMWLPAGKPIDRQVRVTARSFSDSVRAFSPTVMLPPGLRLASRPDSVVLAPGEEREIALRLRGAVGEDRLQMGVIGMVGRASAYEHGFQTIRYPHLPPVRIARSSGMWLQGVELKSPPSLSVAYVLGAGGAVIPQAMRDLGIHGLVLEPGELSTTDLSHFTTVVIGPRAADAHGELLGEGPRLLDWVRRGGTLVVLQGGPATVASSLLPYPVRLAGPPAERVADPAAPVTANRRARVLTWPNVIAARDWSDWKVERAAFVPTEADPQWMRPIETHDPGQPENHAALLVASFGRGAVVYTALSLHTQVAAGNPGALRLLVNLMSAGQR